MKVSPARSQKRRQRYLPRDEADACRPNHSRQLACGLTRSTDVHVIDLPDGPRDLEYELSVWNGYMTRRDRTRAIHAGRRRRSQPAIRPQDPVAPRQSGTFRACEPQVLSAGQVSHPIPRGRHHRLGESQAQSGPRGRTRRAGLRSQGGRADYGCAPTESTARRWPVLFGKGPICS